MDWGLVVFGLYVRESRTTLVACDRNPLRVCLELCVVLRVVLVSYELFCRFFVGPLRVSMRVFSDPFLPKRERAACQDRHAAREHCKRSVLGVN